MTRYLLVVNFERGVGRRRRWRSGSRRRSRRTSTTTRPCTRSWSRSGELVESEVLAGPDLAKIVTSDGATAPVVTDGPFQEFKEWVAGYQIVDVESEARAIEIAAKISAVPGPGGVATQQPIQVRQVMDQVAVRRRRDGGATSSRWVAAAERPPDVEDLLRELAPQVLGVLARRSGDFDAAEDAVQEALLAAADHWSRDGVPAEPRGWLIQTASAG